MGLSLLIFRAHNKYAATTLPAATRRAADVGWPKLSATTGRSCARRHAGATRLRRDWSGGSDCRWQQLSRNWRVDHLPVLPAPNCHIDSICGRLVHVACREASSSSVAGHAASFHSAWIAARLSFILARTATKLLVFTDACNFIFCLCNAR